MNLARFNSLERLLVHNLKSWHGQPADKPKSMGSTSLAKRTHSACKSKSIYFPSHPVTCHFGAALLDFFPRLCSFYPDVRFYCLIAGRERVLFFPCPPIYPKSLPVCVWVVQCHACNMSGRKKWKMGELDKNLCSRMKHTGIKTQRILPKMSPPPPPLST